MFEFLKKKKVKKVLEDEKPPLPAAEVEKIQEKIKIHLASWSQVSEEPEKLAKYYEELGLLQAKIMIDEAIESLETSLKYKASIGEGYKTLMYLYNQKRSEAAYEGNGEKIEKWLLKMDELRQIARNNTINSN